jgi:hypothetical protein
VCYLYKLGFRNNSIQFFIIYVPSQQLQGNLQTQHNVDKQILLYSLINNSSILLVRALFLLKTASYVQNAVSLYNFHF